jgi:hypothetical protein
VRVVLVEKRRPCEPNLRLILTTSRVRECRQSSRIDPALGRGRAKRCRRQGTAAAFVSRTCGHGECVVNACHAHSLRDLPLGHLPRSDITLPYPRTEIWLNIRKSRANGAKTEQKSTNAKNLRHRLLFAPSSTRSVGLRSSMFLRRSWATESSTSGLKTDLRNGFRMAT